MRIATTVVTSLVATAAALTLAGCGSSATSGSSSMGSMSMPAGTSMSGSTSTATSAAHNTADVTFTTDMIPHHGQAVQMADIALRKATSTNITRLARQIKAAQAPEISAMTGWLTRWGTPVPPTSMSGSAMGPMTMNGMMSAQEMSQLETAPGPSFDKLWLQTMIEHHQGAVSMARTELADGQDARAKALAQSIITSQGKEIATMQALQSSL